MTKASERESAGQDSGIVARNFEDGVLERVSGALGTPLFEFALNASTDTLAIGTITEVQRGYVSELDKLMKALQEKQLDHTSINEALRGHLTDVTQSPQPLALMTHWHCGGVVNDLESKDDLELAIVELARDIYPSFLLPPEDTGVPMMRTESFRVTTGLFKHPANKRFQDAVLRDEMLAKLFDQDDPHSGPSVMVYRSTFQGNGLQLWTLAGQVLQSVWRERVSDEPLSIRDFMLQSLERWRFIKAAISGKKQSVGARIAFAGVRLPGGGNRDFGGGVTVREVSPRERSLAPESIKDQLNGTDADGNQVSINYDGDLVAVVQHPYLVRVDKEPHGEARMGFPAELTAENPLENVSTRLRLSLVLAVKRAHRVQIVPTWRAIDDPLSHGYNMGWNDAKQAVNLMPTQLTEDEVAAWKKWYGLLANKKTDKLNLAISRVIRAIGERRDPVDVLIDSVIAWENLFGSKEGEPTLRVTASLALLLEDDYAKRRKLRTRLGKIYALRSDAVHGTAMPDGEQIALCNEALEIALKALQAILEKRSDLLEEPDSTARSLRLLLGATVPDVTI